MSLIACKKLDGSVTMVDKQLLIIRPAAYAIIIQNGSILLPKMIETEKYHLPGGGIEKGERIEDALIREVKEETGIDIKIDKFVFFKEHFFYFDPSKRPYQGIHFYYYCLPVTTELIPDDLVNDYAVEKPRWVPINTLKPEEFQIDGEIILETIRERE